MRIRFQSGAHIFHATLEHTPSAQKLVSILPVEGMVQTWGDEIYFEIPMHTPLEEAAKVVVEPGTVCFWVEGHSVAIPFGPTPASHEDECRLATRVNLMGKVEEDLEVLGLLKTGDRIRVELLSAT